MSSYEDLYKKGKLEQIRDTLINRMKSCDLCPRNCKVNRLEGELGFCRTGRHAKVNSFFLHFGEEPELVGRGGSGTIFLSYCNLGCIYCQNYNLSHLGEGTITSPEELAKMMISLQNIGAENINFVTPTHVIAQIIEALIIAIDKGLTLPLVYNCGGYESEIILKELEGVFDIYMPDIKYSDNTVAAKYSHAPDYWEIVKAAVKEMYRQVGDLVVEKGVAKIGLLIRHLVLPNKLAGSEAVFDFIKEKLSVDAYVNIMAQYHPCYEAFQYDEISRKITPEEYSQAVKYAHSIGLHRGF